MTIIPDSTDERFRPIDLAKAYNRTAADLREGDCSPDIIAAKNELLTGEAVLWGIPFRLGPTDGGPNMIIAGSDEVNVPFPAPVTARQLVFLHAADFKTSPTGEDGITSPMLGSPRLGETVCRYTLLYADGTEAAFPMRRRYQISEFRVKWGENSFEAVKHRKPRTMPGNSDLPRGRAPEIPWGQSQLRTTFQGFGEGLHHWLHALVNPHPDKQLTGLRVTPADGVAFLFGITATSLEGNPLRWDSRRQIRLRTAPDFRPNPFGSDANIGIDLGEVIAVAPVLDYGHESWLNAANPPLPTPKPGEWIVDYAAHPDGRLFLERADGRQTVSLRELETAGIERLRQAERPVTLRIVDRATRAKTAAKIHLHNEHGGYLAPVAGHRLPNAHWFEDYGAEHVEGFHYSCYVDGETEFRLPLGTVYMEVTKGFEIRPVRKKLEIAADTETIEIELDHVLGWRRSGWVTADTHVHFLSPQTALLEGEAEGVNVVNLLASQWGEMFSNLGDFDGRTTIGSVENGGSGEYLVRIGTENRQHVLGHISLLGYEGRMIVPLCAGAPDESGIGDPASVTITQWAKQCREQNGIVVLPHLPNPRAEGAATIVLGEVDAIELCSFENTGISPYSLSDWYRYLNCGYRTPAVGGTDKMSQITAVGTIRTYALIKDKPFTYASWMEAIRSGNTFATFGPLLEFRVNGSEMGSQLQLTSSGGTLDVVWQVSSVTVPVTQIELVVNGELREASAVEPAGGSYAGHWSVPVAGSCWLALRVRGRYQGASEIIAAHSSAVMVVVDGKPLFRAADAVTILEQIEGSTAYIETLATPADERLVKQMLLTLTGAYRALHNRMHQQGVMHRHTAADDHAGHPERKLPRSVKRR
ncbi:CehA/McbA family metallohydrolase [Paenibacillus cymbidii]|uniref:CehA/McbA family metallohydrolase n=1 Tax=Paenibacillus cymbidii TaxID=1639034 RepID=UPI001A9B5C06|nr:CehA/McbA family metallohydrolase [Paenibacillus cymbidii]